MRFCTCAVKLQFRAEMPPHYDLSCVHTLASISCKLFITTRTTECTGQHKRESLDTAEVAMRCHFWPELEFHISNANRSTTGATTWVIRVAVCHYICIHDDNASGILHFQVGEMYPVCVPASAVSILSLFWDSVHAMKNSSSGQKCHHITTSAVSTLWLLYLATFF